MDEDSGEPIVVLQGLEPVRRRAGMYIGELGDAGLHTVLWQVVDNAVDGHQQRRAASYVRVAIDGVAISVEDDGDGLPVGPARGEPERSMLEVIMTTLHGGGWHGYGYPVANALSDRLDVDVWRDGRHHQASYARGVALGPVRDVGPSLRTGTRISFRPDHSILGPCAWNRSAIAARLRQIAATRPALTTIFEHDAVRCPDGIADHVRYLAGGAQALAASVRITGTSGEVAIDVALLWTAADGGETCGLVGTEPVPSGAHVRGLIDGLFGAFAALDAARFAGVRPAAFAERICVGLYAVVHVTLRNPRFRRIGHDELANPEVQPAVAGLVTGALHRRLVDDPPLRQQLLARLMSAG